MFYDPDTKKTFKVWGGHLEFHRGSRKTGVSKDSVLVCIDENGDEEGWVLNQEMVQSIGSHPQVDGIDVIHQVVDGVRSREAFFSLVFTVSLQ